MRAQKKSRTCRALSHRAIAPILIALLGGLGAEVGLAEIPLTTIHKLPVRAEPTQWEGRLEGQVLWTNSAGDSFVLQDGSGTLLVEAEPRTQPLLHIHDYVRLEARGVLAPGTLSMALVNNDGVHATVERSRSIFLPAGRHVIRVAWFNALGDLGLKVEYEGPGLPRQSIPDAVLFHPRSGTNDPTSASAHGLFYRCYEGRWERLPDFERLSSVKTGEVSNFDLSVRTRDREVGLEFTGEIEVSTAGVYTFWTKSDDGSRLYIGQPGIKVEKIGLTESADTRLNKALKSLPPECEGQWTEIQGFVGSMAPLENGGWSAELNSGGEKVPLRIVESSGNPPALFDRIRATGICVSTAAGSRGLLIPSLEQVEVLAAAGGRVSFLATNVAQLLRLGEVSAVGTNCLVHLEGRVLTGTRNSAPIVFQDSSGAALLDLEIPERTLEAGQEILVEGSCLIEGTRLLIRNWPLVENDGVHTVAEQSGSVFLAQGKHPLRLCWFNRDAPYALQVDFQGPGLPRRKIPDSALFHLQPESSSSAPNWTTGLIYHCFAGRWLRVPDMRRLAAVKTGTVANFNISAAPRLTDIGMEFNGYLDITQSGIYNFFTISDDGSFLFIDEKPPRVEVTGTNAVPAPQPIAPGQIIQGPQWSIVEGTISFASAHGGALDLELNSGAGRMRVEVIEAEGVSPLLFLNSRSRVTGIAENTRTTDGEKVAGTLLAPGLAEIDLLEPGPEGWESLPASSVEDVAHSTPAPGEDHFVRVRGTVRTNEGARLVLIGQHSEVLTAQLREPAQSVLTGEVEILGRSQRIGTNIVINRAVYRKAPGSRPDDSRTLPVLTTIEQIKRLTREEAQRGYPVKIRGVLTALLVGGFFIQDATWSIYARADAPLNMDFSHISDYWEVEGATFAEFAPNIRVRRVARLGPGTLPEPLRPAWDQLINGSLDTQYVEVQGIVTAINSNAISLLTRAGKIEVQLEGISKEGMKLYENALIRARGCVIPERNPDTQQVELGRLHLSNPSVSVDSPAPADLFAIGLKRTADLLLFDPRAGSLERVKLAGQVLHERGNAYFLTDGSRGFRAFPKEPTHLPVGAQAEVVGFPELGGPSPILREAVMRQKSVSRLPEPSTISEEALLDGQHDATLVRVNARLTSVTLEGADQVLVLQAGARGFVARLRVTQGGVQNLLPGSQLQLVGVYAGLGGDRLSGRPIESFELLLNSASDVRVIERPSWWTVSHTLSVVGGMALIIVAALIWIRLLRTKVEERSRQLRAEIQSHEHTEGQRELEAERARIARDLHDDLGATLTQIRLLSALQSRDPQVPETSRGRMKQVSEKSREMVASLDEIVWAVNPANDSLPSLAIYLCQFAEEFFRATPIRCRLDVDDALPAVPLTSEVRHHLYLVVREALNNIAKHSEATEVWLRIQWGEGIHVAIEDNGRGFAPTSVIAGEGLANMRVRLEKIGGRFECNTRPGAGAVCRITLPMTLSPARAEVLNL